MGHRFERSPNGLLERKKMLLERISASLHVQIVQAAYDAKVDTPAADGDPLDERMTAMVAGSGFPTPQKSLDMRLHAETGLRTDPKNPRLLGLLANVLASDVLNAWNDAGKPEVDRAEAAARKAISLNPHTALAHYALGLVHRLRGNHEAALSSFNDAIRVDPHLAKAYAQAGNVMVFLGNARGAIPLVEKATQLSPQDPSIGPFFWIKGRAYFILGDYPKAIEALEESVRLRPNLWFNQAWLVAAYALSDRDAEARKALAQFEKAPFYRRFDLDRIAEYYRQEQQFQNPTLQAATAQLLGGLRKAGMKSASDTNLPRNALAPAAV